MNTSTSAIDTNLYPKIAKALDKNLAKYKATMGKFIAIRSSAMYDVFPSSRILYGTRDIIELYDCLGITDQEVYAAISPAYYFGIPEFNPKAAKDTVTCVICCIIKYFFLKKDQKNLDLAMIYLVFSGKFYPSIHYKYFKIAEPKQYQHVVDYVVNQYMDSKFDIKAKGSLYGAMTQLCNTCISTYGDKFFTQKIMSDEDYVYWIQQVHTRIDSLIKNCASAYYECYQKKLYMTYTSDNITDDANSFRIAESDLSRAEILAQNTMTLLNTRDVDFARCKYATNKTDRVNATQVADFMTKTLKDKNNLPLLSELIRLNLVLYIRDSGQPTIDDYIGFLTYIITPTPNTTDKDKIRQKELLTTILKNNSDAYRKRSVNLKVEAQYRQALNMYLALSIIEADKKSHR